MGSEDDSVSCVFGGYSSLGEVSTSIGARNFCSLVMKGIVLMSLRGLLSVESVQSFSLTW